MEYYGNKLCVSYQDLVDGGIVSACNYRNLVNRGKVDVVRKGGGRGSCALIAVDSLPESYREEVRSKYPNGSMVLLVGWVNSNYELDQGAVVFFHDRNKTGVDLPEDKAREYIINASVLNTCIKLYDRAKDYRKLMGEKYVLRVEAGLASTRTRKYFDSNQTLLRLEPNGISTRTTRP